MPKCTTDPEPASDGDPAGDRVPGSIEAVVSGGIAWDATKDLTLALRGRCFGPRPLEDDSVRSGSSTLFSLPARWDPLGSWPIQLEPYNLLDAEVSDIDYYYASRLPG
jgi:hypothetical protein